MPASTAGGGNGAAGSSIQRTRQRSVASTGTSAEPTGPAPNSATSNDCGAIVSVISAMPPVSHSRQLARAAAVSGSLSRAASGEGPNDTRRTVAAPAATRFASDASQPRSPMSSRSNASTTAPPQHWPRLGPSAKRSSLRACGTCAPSFSHCRAMSIACHSRWPPPIVWRAPSRVTTILVPASRGAEPSTCATVTSTAASPRASNCWRSPSQGSISVLRERRRVRHGACGQGRDRRGCDEAAACGWCASSC